MLLRFSALGLFDYDWDQSAKAQQRTF